jgi:hypothetical protein
MFRGTSGDKKDQAVQAASARSAGWDMADGAESDSIGAGIPQVHRVFSYARMFAIVLREHNKHSEFIGPRFLVYTAALEMHPLDTEDRLADLKKAQGIGYCKHHQVLHQGLSRGHHHNGQRDHSAEGAGGRRIL